MSVRAARARQEHDRGAVLLAEVTEVAASAVSTAAPGIAGDATGGTAGVERVAIGMGVEEERLRLVHRGGSPLDVRRLRLCVRVDGEWLAHQSTVPFFAATVFWAGALMPVNATSDPTWVVGGAASLRAVPRDRPALGFGSKISFIVYDEGRIATQASATV